MTSEGAQWVRIEGPYGVRVDITRFTDGRVMCCLCFDYKTREELHQVEPGVVTDVCEACWQDEERTLQARGKSMKDVFPDG